jgi:predicted amidohydrolase YtcJ
VWRVVPLPSIDELAQAIRAALPVAAAAGLTGFHSFEDARSLESLRVLDRAGELSLRVWHGVPRDQLREAQQLGLRTGRGTDNLRIGPVKLYADGALGSRTAYLLEPYEGRADGYRGLPTLQPDELVDDLRVAAEAGLDIAVHAIGDAAVRGVLDAVEAARRVAPALGERLVRIEHAQLVHPTDVPRFAALDVIASMQPSHAVSDWRAADAHWGARACHGYAWRTLLSAGARLAFGTDAPVESIEPLPSLHAAVTRRDARGEPPGGWYPDERLSLLEAVRAYTLGAAHAGRAEHRRGSLVVGKDADLVVLSADPFQLDPEQLLELQVELTMVGGRIVHPI